jgi:hypothetical protein
MNTEICKFYSLHVTRPFFNCILLNVCYCDSRKTHEDLQVHHVSCNNVVNLEVPIHLPINTLHYILTWQILREEVIKYILFERIHYFYIVSPRKFLILQHQIIYTVSGRRPKDFEYYKDSRVAQCMA